MKFEYQPFQLKTWMREKRNIEMRDVEVSKKYEGKLESLKQEFAIVQTLEEKDFELWISRLDKKQRLLLPYVYKKELKEIWKKKLLDFYKNQIKDQRRSFRVLVDVLYKTCDVDGLWPLIRFAYVSHLDSNERRMDKHQSKQWRSFLQSKQQISYLAKSAYEGEQDFIDELESFYLTENLPLFKYVLLDTLEIADEEFFIKEQKLYKKYFEEGTNLEQQKMADSLIKKCNLNRVKKLGRNVIFEKLKTYRRKPELWRYVGEEEKERFARWVLKLELREFFGQVNKSHERFQYWEKFIVNLEDVVVTDQKKTLVMYFSNVVVMEVLDVGAVYVYETRVFNQFFQPKIARMLEEKEKYKNSWIQPKEVKRPELMDKSRIVKGGWLQHSPRNRWQAKFDDWLKNQLGWEVNKHVLAQKEKERDEDDFEA
ncbi:hypothetical protein SAMN04487944_1276 [Gracilibacillus ureilyticus]|uniref:EH_Signature domain-containing protein n=1 Tax=Gracilibacillus ureilyticus TaxID=531814 RepID=A0A1H9VS35_9BACI|nr:hypothetical protein [Gracilibacillus ureilyticus]SES24546.1 hypothetical protein SAMN04487944_1276 [Gracilibacillus ureilyticus]